MISVTIPFTSPAGRGEWGRSESEGGERRTNQLPKVSTDRISGDPDVIHVQEGQTEELPVGERRRVRGRKERRVLTS
jgi:hypothetical protein